MWLLFAVLSSLLLGGYDILKKSSLKGNAVLPVLFVAACSGALLFVPLLLLSYGNPEWARSNGFSLAILSPREHLWVFLKSALVGASWILNYYAMKYLPLTTVSPIRSTGPLWTVMGALLIFGERLSWLQWIGLTVSLLFFWYFSLGQRKEGFSFSRNRWMICIYAGTLLGSMSGLYDKFLVARLDRIAMQAWFSLYLLPVILPFVLLRWYPRRKNDPFLWRWTIPMIGVVLTVTDFVYFYALSFSGSLISIVSAVRRTSVVVPFLAGVFLFHEKRNLLPKVIALAGMVLGVLLIALGTS